MYWMWKMLNNFDTYCCQGIEQLPTSVLCLIALLSTRLYWKCSVSADVPTLSLHRLRHCIIIYMICMEMYIKAIILCYIYLHLIPVYIALVFAWGNLWRSMFNNTRRTWSRRMGTRMYTSSRVLKYNYLLLDLMTFEKNVLSTQY